ncbi:MAG: pyridoxamine 5'-phosphate oxidase-like FMN-binding protein [Puniceicoccaceae bacterium 5H]|nr:MAG: pyridoxamine 5'-phosphate oxidase-like FMN-binding protein [Puniceicoccaceae bacterium 5H]
MTKATATIQQNTETEAILAEAKAEYARLLEAQKSVILGTVNSQGEPDASYAPALRDENNHYYVYISALAKHTSALKSGRKVSLLVIEDEGSAAQLFARKRATFSCLPELIERDSTDFNQIMDRMALELGDIVGGLRNMVDFDLFRLEPQEGRLVTGFGRAFRLSGDGMRELQHLGGRGHGHKTKVS